MCGYSFGDEHINERIISALQGHTTAHVFVMQYDIEWQKDQAGNEIPISTFCVDSSLGKMTIHNRKISVMATRNAIIGGKFGEWNIKTDNRLVQ